MNHKKARVDISICIVSWNTSKILRKCIRSIYFYSTGISLEIIVIDNGSSDDTCEMIKKEFPKIILIENRENLGFGKANNIALKICRGEFVALMNSDILMTEKCFDTMIQYMKKNIDTGVITCRLVHKNGKIQKNYFKNFPTPITEFCRGIFLERFITNFKREEIAGIIECNWVTGAFLFLRKELISYLEGFDDIFFMYGEDIDLCYRIKKSGKKVIYFGNISMVHYHGESTKKHNNDNFETIMQKESVYKFMKKNYGLIFGFTYRIVWIFTSIYRTILLLILSICCQSSSNKIKDFILENIYKHYKIIEWGTAGLHSKILK